MMISKKVNNRETYQKVRQDILEPYSNPDLYTKVDAPGGNVYVFKSYYEDYIQDRLNSDLKNKIEKNIRGAESLARKGHIVYILPEKIVIMGEIYNGEISDSIVNGYLTEFKELTSFTYSQFKKQLKNGLRKADVVYMRLSRNEIIEKGKTRSIFDLINGQTSGRNKYEGKMVIVSSDGEEFVSYVIKNGTPNEVPFSRLGDLPQPECSVVERNESVKSFKKEAQRKAEAVLFKNKIEEGFNKQIDSILEGDIGIKDKTIVFSDSTPNVFISLGLDDLTVEMYIDKLARGLLLDESVSHGHSSGLSKNIVKAIRNELGNPLAVFDSASVKGRLVALYDISDMNGDSVIVIVSPKARKSNAVEINLISSIYGKGNGLGFKAWINKRLLRYVDNTREKSLALRLQLPSTKTLYVDNVLTKSQLVNNNTDLYFYDSKTKTGNKSSKPEWESV